MATLYEKVKDYLDAKGYNILSKTVLDDKIQLFVQKKEGLEELIIDEELFSSPYFSEATYIYTKLVERDLTVFEGRDLLDILDDIETLAKKGAYIQRYKGLGEMNPEQLWDTTLNPESRTMIRIVFDEDHLEAELETFNLLMGKKEAKRRREWMEEKGNTVEIDA